MQFVTSNQDSFQNDNRRFTQIHADQISNYQRSSAYICGSKLILLCCSLVTAIISVGASGASAQLTIQSTGTLSGTIQLPSFNPNFNTSTTRVDTDSTGAYYRNIGTQQNPNNVLVYQSNYVKVNTRSDGSLHYYVDFKGIPVVSFDGTLTSPVLSGGQLDPFTYQGRLPGVKFQGVVQDEFNITKGLYTGIVTDPKTGQQYQGTFQVQGYGPRYSFPNGGESPTVFDFKSDLPGKPTVTSLVMTNSPLVRLTIQVPADATPISSSGGGSTITPPPTTGGSTTSPPPSPPTGGGASIVTTPPTTSGSTTPTTSPTTGGSTTPTTSPTTSGSTTPTTSPITGGSTTPTTSPTTSGSTTPTTALTTGGSSTPTTSPTTGGSTTPTTSPISGGSTTPTTSPITGGSTTPTTSPISGGSTTPT
ncbi:MAG: hypothetical protein SAL70_10075, partial [Scytonema sp. PMC 1070.18]|nr:hypothetical protein [Scytonema sp. PMC 1070.18]